MFQRDVPAASILKARGFSRRQAWNKAARLANDARRFLLPEDLLHAPTEDPDARLVLRTCGIDVEELRTFLATRLKVLPAEWAEDGKPPVTEGTYNLAWGPMDQAVRLAAAAGHKETTGAHPLLAVLSDQREQVFGIMRVRPSEGFEADMPER